MVPRFSLYVTFVSALASLTVLINGAAAQQQEQQKLFANPMQCWTRVPYIDSNNERRTTYRLRNCTSTVSAADALEYTRCHLRTIWRTDATGRLWFNASEEMYVTHYEADGCMKTNETSWCSRVDNSSFTETNTTFLNLVNTCCNDTSACNSVVLEPLLEVGYGAFYTSAADLPVTEYNIVYGKPPPGGLEPDRWCLYVQMTCEHARIALHTDYYCTDTDAVVTIALPFKPPTECDRQRFESALPIGVRLLNFECCDTHLCTPSWDATLGGFASQTSAASSLTRDARPVSWMCTAAAVLLFRYLAPGFVNASMLVRVDFVSTIALVFILLALCVLHDHGSGSGRLHE